MHIVFVIANESSVPYFNWFVEKAVGSDHQFSFVALYNKRPKMLDEMSAKGRKAHWIYFDPSKRKTGMIKCFFRLHRLFKRLKPDVVHTHLFDDSIPGLLAARTAGVKKRVITKQDTTFHWYYAPKWVWFDKFNNWNATHIHAVATENKKFILEKERVEEKKVHLVRNGFPYELMTASSPDDIAYLKKKYVLEGRTVVGTVARYIQWKGHHLIIDAAQELIKKYPTLLFIWAGSDSESGYKDELQRLINDRGLQDHITLLGWIERHQMPSLYKSMDIYLHPAINEPFGFAISEALMNGVPIVATKTGSTDLIKHLKEGYLLKENNYEDIVDGISFLLEDANRLESVKKKGYQHALEHLTFNKMWEGHMEMYAVE